MGQDAESNKIKADVRGKWDGLCIEDGLADLPGLL
jgi:hypothetical protein